MCPTTSDPDISRTRTDQPPRWGVLCIQTAQLGSPPVFLTFYLLFLSWLTRWEFADFPQSTAWELEWPFTAPLFFHFITNRPKCEPSLGPSCWTDLQTLPHIGWQKGWTSPTEVQWSQRFYKDSVVLQVLCATTCSKNELPRVHDEHNESRTQEVPLQCATRVCLQRPRRGPGRRGHTNKPSPRAILEAFVWWIPHTPRRSLSCLLCWYTSFIAPPTSPHWSNTISHITSVFFKMTQTMKN